ncbi:hypothetical protein PoB_002759200 [Plakobranchus ocellatus]|uniref:Uncharacterized protein n=1 Tax=Plakobranchus ocellatus TaxID=259542 RepID=A0AAV4A1A7_9GAST|nr:hypothetical protein PoB_002759200 [Plakobranchus ocellatus]
MAMMTMHVLANPVMDVNDGNNAYSGLSEWKKESISSEQLYSNCLPYANAPKTFLLAEVIALWSISKCKEALKAYNDIKIMINQYDIGVAISPTFKEARSKTFLALAGASLAQWLTSQPRDLQGPFFRRFEPCYRHPGLTEDPKARGLAIYKNPSPCYLLNINL